MEKKHFLNNSKGRKKTFEFIFTLIFLTLMNLFCFFGGSFSNRTLIEEYSSTIARFCKNNDDVFEVYHKPDRDNIASELYSERVKATEQNNLNFGFASMQSLLCSNNLENDITINQINDRSYTIIYSDVMSNHDDDRRGIIFDAYFLKLMFKDSNTGIFTDEDNFCYITKDDADNLLLDLGYSDSKPYEVLLNSHININYNNFVKKMRIANIIIPYGDFYERCSKHFGHFILSSLIYENLKSNIIVSNFLYPDTYFNFQKIEMLQKRAIEENIDFKIKDDIINELNSREFESILNHGINNNIEFLKYIFYCLSSIFLILIIFINNYSLFKFNLLSIFNCFFIYSIMQLNAYFSKTIKLFSFESLIMVLIINLALLALNYFMSFVRKKGFANGFFK